MIISAPEASSEVATCTGVNGFGESFSPNQGKTWNFDTVAGICGRSNLVPVPTNGFSIGTASGNTFIANMYTSGVTGSFGVTSDYAAHNVTAVSISPSSGFAISSARDAGFGIMEVILDPGTSTGNTQFTIEVTKRGRTFTVILLAAFTPNRQHVINSITVTGEFGGDVTADDAQAITSSFANAGVRTHNWGTQIQIFNRFFGGTGIVGGDGGASFAPNVARPSGLNFHSAEIRNDLQARRLQMRAESYAEIKNSTYYGDNNSDETNKLDANKLDANKLAEWLMDMMGNLTLASQSAEGTGLYDVWASGGYATMELATPGAAYTGQLFYGRVGADYKLDDNTLVGVGLGYERGHADVVLDNTDYNSQAFSVAGYWGVKLPDDMLLFDGSVGLALVAYDFEGDINKGDFYAGRLFATANLTGIYELPDMLQLRPKVGLLYSDEHQQAYTDGAGVASAARMLQLGRLSFGGELHFTGYDKVQPYITIQGEWDFIRPDIVTLSNGSDYRAGEFGASVGGGMSIELMPNLLGSVEVSFDSIGREDFNAWSTRGEVIYLF